MDDMTGNGKIQTVADLMLSIEDEIKAVKSGDLKEAQARIIMRGRTLQLKGVELYLQAARFEAKLRPGLVKRLLPEPEKAEGGKASS